MPKTINWFQALINSPVRVFIYCLFFLFINLVINGSLYRLYELNQNLAGIETKIIEEQSTVKKMQTVIKAAQDPQFMARQARDQLELLEKDDLLFVFTDEAP